MIIGGQAVLLYGEPRLTRDIDVTLGSGPDRLEDLLGAVSELGLVVLPEDPAKVLPGIRVMGPKPDSSLAEPGKKDLELCVNVKN